MVFGGMSHMICMGRYRLSKTASLEEMYLQLNVSDFLLGWVIYLLYKGKSMFATLLSSCFLFPLVLLSIGSILKEFWGGFRLGLFDNFASSTTFLPGGRGAGEGEALNADTRLSPVFHSKVLFFNVSSYFIWDNINFRAHIF